MLAQDLYDDYKMVLDEAKSMGCTEIRALHHIPLKNMNFIVNALKKQTPYKVKIEQWTDTRCICGYVFSEDLDDGYYTVPLENKTNFCRNCGQKLDWNYMQEDEENEMEK